MQNDHKDDNKKRRHQFVDSFLSLRVFFASQVVFRFFLLLQFLVVLCFFAFILPLFLPLLSQFCVCNHSL